MTEDDYFDIIDGKTAELTACCCRLGALYADADDETVAPDRTRPCLGLAFQIADDLLDLTGLEEATGKTLGTDLAQQKLTLPIIYMLDHLPSDDAARPRCYARRIRRVRRFCPTCGRPMRWATPAAGPRSMRRKPGRRWRSCRRRVPEVARIAHRLDRARWTAVRRRARVTRAARRRRLRRHVALLRRVEEQQQQLARHQGRTERRQENHLEIGRRPSARSFRQSAADEIANDRPKPRINMLNSPSAWFGRPSGSTHQ